MRMGSEVVLIGIAAMLVGCAAEELDDDSGGEDVDGDGWTAESGDCDDLDANVHPDAHELCDDQDNDCDGTQDEGCPPVCGDGFAAGSYEECDGVDDGACPGRCSGHCACPATEPGDLQIHLIDVGQGDAILVISPDGFAMLLDAGDEGQAPTVLGYLDSQGLTGLDYTLVSHMHDDHLGSMDDVLDAHSEVVASFDHGGDYTTASYQGYDAAAAERRGARVEGDRVDLGPSVEAEVIHAHRDGDNENDNSVVLRITYGGVRVLLGGDCETDGCETRFDPGPIDVYKVHHHGSGTATSGVLLGQMSATTALISVGADNPFGHPAQSTLDRLDSYGIVVHRTDLAGDIVVVSDGKTYSVNGEAGRGANRTAK